MESDSHTTLPNGVQLGLGSYKSLLILSYYLHSTRKHSSLIFYNNWKLSILSIARKEFASNSKEIYNFYKQRKWAI